MLQEINYRKKRKGCASSVLADVMSLSRGAVPRRSGGQAFARPGRPAPFHTISTHYITSQP